MSTKALAIIEEFLRSSDPQLRRNGTTALAALGTPESIALLVQQGLTDAEPSVRQRVEEELGKLPEDALPLAAGQLDGALADPARARRAYAMLGRLRGNGVRLTTGAGGPRRLQLAWAQARYERGGRKWGARGRMFLTGLVAGAVGVLLTALYIWLAFGKDTVSQLGAYSTVALILAPVLAAALTWRSQPINLQYDKGAAALVEGAWILVGTSAVVAPLLALAILSEGLPPVEPELLMAFLYPALTFVAVRAGTLLAYGAVAGPASRYVQTAVGTLFGLALSSAIAVTIGSRDVYEMWLVAVPALVAVAHGFATIDARSPSGGPIAGRTGLYLAAGLAVIIGTVILAAAAATAGRVRQTHFKADLPFAVSFNIGINDTAVTDFRVTAAGASRDSVVALAVTAHGEIARDLDLEFRRNRIPIASSRYRGVQPSGSSHPSVLVMGLDTGAHNLRVTRRSPEATWESTRSSAVATPEAVFAGLASSVYLMSRAAVDTTLFLYKLYVIPLGEAPSSGSTDARARVAAHLRGAVVGPARYDTPGAVALLDLAERLVGLVGRDSAVAESWNSACWRGAIAPWLDTIAVQRACDRAVAASPHDPNILDSRGVYRARTGDFAGARPDFQAFVNWPQADATARSQRLAWIEELKQGRNPFTDDVLRALR